ncbi:MAG: hypothetical protein J5W83_18905 [Candidatus Accumulibacter sp.]|uniref:hypothetical protein n=1 Tax=Accumulibacter sp. TaxID=2053492 RepID=UPI001B117182|nr:hypothetical protein [Accumulibacter sp.]MBO3704572.1 hypothetical protein [Accumulibacter sp.]
MRITLSADAALPKSGTAVLVQHGPRFDHPDLIQANDASGGALARAIATALHERPRLLGVRPDESALRRQAQEELQRLAEAGQIIVVTHSPQVAARGGQHDE